MLSSRLLAVLVATSLLGLPGLNEASIGLSSAVVEQTVPASARRNAAVPNQSGSHGTITGRILSQTQDQGPFPQGDSRANLVNKEGESVSVALASWHEGRYLFANVIPGEYTLLFEPPIRNGATGPVLLSQWLGGVDSFAEATFFRLDSGGALELEDVVLELQGGSISTRVLGSVLGKSQRIDSVNYYIQSENFSISNEVSLDPSGEIVFRGLPDGDYRVCFESAMAMRIWLGKCHGGEDRTNIHLDEGVFSPVRVEAGRRAVIPDVTLNRGGVVYGEVSGPGIPFGEAEPLIRVMAYDRQGKLAGESDTHERFNDGFGISLLPTGEYTLHFTVINEENEGDYTDHWLGGSESFEGAEFFSIRAGQSLSMAHEIPRNTPLKELYPVTGPTIVGAPRVGSQLSVSPVTWNVPTGDRYAPVRWFRDGRQVHQGPTYTPSTADLGALLTAEVRMTLANHAPGLAVADAIRVPRPLTSRVGLVASRSEQTYGEKERVRLSIPVRHSDGSPAVGTVDLFRDAIWVASLPIINGMAAYRLPASEQVGTRVFRAEYHPARADVEGAVSPERAVTVTKAPVEINARALPAWQGWPAVVQVTLEAGSGFPIGTVQIRRGTIVLAQAKVLTSHRGRVEILLPANFGELGGLSARYLGSSVAKQAEVSVHVVR